MQNSVKDTYQIPASESESEYKEKGSKFLAYLYPVTSIEDVENRLEEVRGIHPKARHHCYAYRIGIEGDIYRANDDGEPSGTAGKPIHGQLLSHEVSDCLIVVVRYFGGTKLGASGLINAYKTAAHEALHSVEKKDKVLSTSYSLVFEYGEMGHVMNVIKKLKLPIAKKEFGQVPFIEISIPLSKEETSIVELKAHLLNITTDQITDDTKIPFCTIEKLIENA